MTNTSAARTKQARLIQDAFSRGQDALGMGDRAEAMRWLDRARRLAPNNSAITLTLAAAAIGGDNPRAAALFSQVLKVADSRDAWLGLATVRFLMGELAAARAALAEVLSRYALRPETQALAAQIARLAGGPGWCGLTGDGVLIVEPARRERIDTMMDGRPIAAGALSPAWPRGQSITVMAGDHHLIGSPISLSAIGRIEGHVEASNNGIRGWAWHPGDPDTDPRLSIGPDGSGREIVAAEPADGVSDLPPLARARSFALKWADLATTDTPVHLRGRDGRDLSGSPVSRVNIARSSTSPHANPPRPGSGRQDDLKRWRAEGQDAVILITHDDGGGVERRIQAAIASHEAAGRRAIVLRPVADQKAGVTVRSTGLPDLRFELPREQPALLRLLRDANPVEIEFHHFLNHDPSIFQIVRALGVPYDAHTHDYAWFCPRIALVGRGNRYCGEPGPDACEACVTKTGSYLNEDIRVTALLKRSRRVLSGARRVIAPSHDAAARMARNFNGIFPIVVPHEDDGAVDDPPPISRVTGTVRVCVAGGIGLHKGYNVLLACARDAEKRALDLTFVVAGTTIDDQRLIDTGRVFVTGPYQPDEAVALIRAQNATLALLPSIWPETWCLGLTELWRAGLRVAAFDTGAPAERIRRTGRGFLLRLGLSPPAINDTLLNAARG